ncbi:MAG: hypothetical protein WCP97_08055 [bacterium]
MRKRFNRSLATVSLSDCKVRGEITILSREYAHRKTNSIPAGATALIPIDGFSFEKWSDPQHTGVQEVLEVFQRRIRERKYPTEKKVSPQIQKAISEALGRKAWATLEQLMQAERQERLKNRKNRTIAERIHDAIFESREEKEPFDQVIISLRSRLAQLGLRGGVIIDEEGQAYLLAKNLSKTEILLKKGLGLGRELFIPKGSRIEGNELVSMVQTGEIKAGEAGKDFVYVDSKGRVTSKKKKISGIALRLDKWKNWIPGEPSTEVLSPYDPESINKKMLRTEWQRLGIHNEITVEEAQKSSFFVTQTTGTFSFGKAGRDNMVAVIEHDVKRGKMKNGKVKRLRKSGFGHIGSTALDPEANNGVATWPIRMELLKNKHKTHVSKLLAQLRNAPLADDEYLYVHVCFYHKKEIARDEIEHPILYALECLFTGVQQHEGCVVQ